MNEAFLQPILLWTRVRHRTISDYLESRLVLSAARDRGAALANGKAKIDDIRATDFVARSVQPL